MPRKRKITLQISLLLSCWINPAFSEELIPDVFMFNNSGQCPFTVTNGPQIVRYMELHMYGDTQCTVDNQQYSYFLNEMTGTPIFNDGVYSFNSNNQIGPVSICQQAPQANSFTLTQYSGTGTAVSSCFVLTSCSSSEPYTMTCAERGTLVLTS